MKLRESCAVWALSKHCYTRSFHNSILTRFIPEGVRKLVISFRRTLLIALQTLLNNYKLWWHISALMLKLHIFVPIFDKVSMCKKNIRHCSYATLIILACKKRDPLRIKKKNLKKKNKKKPNLIFTQKTNCNLGEPVSYHGGAMFYLLPF